MFTTVYLEIICGALFCS